MHDQNNHHDAGKFIMMAGFAVLTAALTAALMHKPTRKKIRSTLEEGIDMSDKKLDEMEHQIKDLASQTGKKLTGARKATISDLQSRLADLQQKLDALS